MCLLGAMRVTDTKARSLIEAGWTPCAELNAALRLGTWMMDELTVVDYHSTWRLLYPLHLGPSAYKSKAKYGRPLTVHACTGA